MDWIFILSCWGGSFFFLNKVFFLITEWITDEQVEQRWRIRSWAIYLAGVVPWLVIFAINERWIALAIEVTGIPTLVLGLLSAKEPGKEHKWLDRTALIIVGAVTVFSIWQARELTYTHLLELGIAIGFFYGAYLLAKKNHYGYLFFVLMNVSNAWLQQIDGAPLLMTQQIASAIIVATAFGINRYRIRN